MLVGAFDLATGFFRWLRGRQTGCTGSAPARILVTGTFFADNWVEAHIRPLALSERCEHVWVVADRPFVPMEKVSYVCPPRWLQKMIGRVAARSILFVLAALWRRPHVVGGFHLLCNGLLALMVARMLAARAMYFCVGGWAEFVKGGVHGGNHFFTLIARDDEILERSLLRAVRQFDLILTMGSGAREFLLDRGVGCPVHVMSGGIDPRRYAPRGLAKKYDLVTVCRLASVKRLDVFLDVVRRAAEKVPTVSAVIVGDGPQKAFLQKAAAAMGLADRVRFAGRQANVERWLAESRLFVLTSDSEGLSLALMEATMAGLPAVVSDVGDLGDLVRDGVNGFRPPPRRADRFADCVVRLLTDEDLYRRFSAAARQAAKAYSVQAACRRWSELLGQWGFRAAPGQPLMGDTLLGRFCSRKGLWELSRAITRRSAGRVLSIVPPGLWLGRKFRQNVQFLRRADRWSRDEAAAYQLAQLRRVISLAYERSPYYRQVFRECGFEPGDLRSLEDLAALPTIDADTIRGQLGSVCTVQRRAPTIDLVSTGGTGGRPLHFYIGSDRSAFEYAHLVASWQRVGYLLQMPMAVLRGRVVRPDRTGLHHEYDPLLRHHHFSNFHMTDEHMRRYLEYIRRIGPCFLHVYPSTVAMLARFIRRVGIEAPRNVRAIIAESEIVYPDQRRMVEEVFGCRYFSCYGHTEKVVFAAECEHSTHYHVWPTYSYFELLDEKGRPITTPGRRGEIVGTGFINAVVPFIRYRTGDFATYVAEKCKACGREQMLIEDVRGHRTQEILIAADGSEIPWAALNVHDETFACVRQFQFYQDTPGRAVLRVVPADGFSEQHRLRILRSLERKLHDRVALTIEMADKIPLSPRGKAIYVDQRIVRPTNGIPGT